MARQLSELLERINKDAFKADFETEGGLPEIAKACDELVEELYEILSEMAGVLDE